MKKKFTLLLLCVTIALSYSASAQDSAINLAGNVYAESAADIVPANLFTIEFWVYTPTIATSTGYHQFVASGSNSGQDFYIGYNDATGDMILGDLRQTTTVPIPMPQNKWVHVAMVVDNISNYSVLYLNGVMVDSSTLNNYFALTGSNPLEIGRGTDFASYATAKIDELKLWDIARSPDQVKQDMFSSPVPSTADLIAYYKMDEGAGTAVGNTSTNGAGSGAVLNSASWTHSPIQGGVNALSFDPSTNSNVSIPTNTAYDFPQGTIELWVNPGTLTSDGDMISVRGGGGSRFSFLLNPSGLIKLWNNTSVSSIPWSYTPGTWYHLAFACTPTQTNVYIDGVLQSTPLNPINTAITGQPLSIGISDNGGSKGEPFAGSIDEVRLWNTVHTASEIVTDMGNTLAGNETGLVGLYSFDYGIAGGDNTGLTLALDYSTMTNNGTINNFTATPGALSNFVAHPITPLPVNFISFTATAQKDQSLLQWKTAQEQNSSDYVIERSPDGTKYSDIGSVPAAGNSSLPLSYSFIDPAPLTGKNYYRLKETDLDGKFMYSVVRTVVFGTTTSTRKLVWFSTGSKAVEVDLLQGNNELYTVTDLGGQALQQGQLSAGKLYLTKLPAGLYVVKVITAAGQQLDTKVLVK